MHQQSTPIIRAENCPTCGETFHPEKPGTGEQCRRCAYEARRKPQLTLQQRFAAELHRIADDIVRLDLPLGRHLSLDLGVLDSRADLDRWAGHLGSTVDVDSSGIPHTTHSTPLPEGRYGAELAVNAQSPKDQLSEVERLRAEVAQLRAQAGGAA